MVSLPDCFDSFVADKHDSVHNNREFILILGGTLGGGPASVHKLGVQFKMAKVCGSRAIHGAIGYRDDSASKPR